MLLSVWCLGVALVSLVAIGVPVAWLVGGRKPLTTFDWILAPCLGMAAIVLVLQNLVYLDVSIRHSAPFLWAAALLGWLWLWWSGQLGVCLARCPKAVYAALLFVVAVHALGLFWMGARGSMGGGDQYNYTVMADFFAEQRISTAPRDAEHNPGNLWVVCWLVKDRIGQSMLHAFFVVSSQGSGATLFGPTMVVGLALVLLPVYLLARSLGVARGPALAAAVVAGLVPGMTLLHVRGSLSHVLSFPLLLCLPAGLQAVFRQPTWRRLCAAALVMAAATSIYTEFWPVFIGVLLVMLAVAVPCHPTKWRLLASAAAVAVSGVLLNPGFWGPFLNILCRCNAPVPGTPFPYGLSVEGWSRLWLGNLVDYEGRGWPTMFRMASMTITALGYCGLAATCLRLLDRGRWTWVSTKRRLDLALAVGVLALAVVPLAIATVDDDHPYQAYKTLISIAPLLVMGLAQLKKPEGLLTSLGRGALAMRSGSLAAWIALIVCFLMTCAGTCQMLAADAANNSIIANQLGALTCQRKLESLQSADLLIEVGENSSLAAWAAYHGRQNRIWLARTWCNRVADEQLMGILAALFKVDVGETVTAVRNLQVRSGNMPGEVYVLTLPVVMSNDQIQPCWSNGVFTLHRAGAGPWAILLKLDGLHLMGDGAHLCLTDEPVTLDVLAGQAGMVTLVVQLASGPDLPATATRQLLLRTDAGLESLVTVNGQVGLTVPVKAGRNQVTVRPLDVSRRLSPSRGKTRAELWKVKGILRLQCDAGG